MKVKDLPVLISQGKLDPLLDQMSHACERRKKYLEEQKGLEVLASLEVGDSVTVRTNNMRPKYLNGSLGEVVGTTPNAKGQIEVRIITRRGNNVWLLPPRVLEKG